MQGRKRERKGGVDVFINWFFMLFLGCEPATVIGRDEKWAPFDQISLRRAEAECKEKYMCLDTFERLREDSTYKYECKNPR